MVIWSLAQIPVRRGLHKHAACWGQKELQESPDVYCPGRQMESVHLQQGSHVQHVTGEGVHGGDPSQQGSMVMKPEVGLNALTQWCQ